MQNSAFFYKLEIEHIGCWTSYVPAKYIDILIGYTYYNQYLKAIRLSKDFNKNDFSKLKGMMRQDSSVKLINAYNVDNSSSIISMNVDYHETFLDKLIELHIFPIKSGVSKNHENYIFLSDNGKIAGLKNQLQKFERIKIIKFQEINSDTIIPEIGNFLMDIFLTEREREIIKFAKENGFFNIPRKSSNTELASQLKISKMAMSVEIRKALNKIVEKIYK